MVALQPACRQTEAKGDQEREKQKAIEEGQGGRELDLRVATAEQRKTYTK